MAQILTYADRELLLQTFDKLKDEWNGSDEDLLTDAFNWARGLQPSSGYEHSLTRDIAALSKYLYAYKDDQDLAGIARGGLLYVMLGNKYGPSRLGNFGLLDESFIASYAVHEIRSRLGEKTTHNPSWLTESEKKQAENLFLELAEKPLLEDKDLIEKSREKSKEFEQIGACGLFRRMQRNIDFLIATLEESSRDQDHQCYARAALSYFIYENDIIDDRLGIAGFLDDNFIIQLAVDLIEPAREPFLEMLDATVEAWPFLNGLIIDEGSGYRPISEFMILNSALLCPQLRGDNFKFTNLILPAPGPTPLIVGFITALGLIHRSGNHAVTEDSFTVGQKVCIDNNVIAEFAGIREYDGRRMFGLTQFRQQRGISLPSTRYWPISEIHRLVPAEETRVTRGNFVMNLKKSGAILPALEFLFNQADSNKFSFPAKKIIVVTPVISVHSLAKRLRLYGQPLKEVVSMGHLVDGNVRPWSKRFGQDEPMMIFASDLDTACVYAEENLSSIDSVIIDAEGRNASRIASLNTIKSMGLRTLMLMSERTANEFQDGSGVSEGIWEWGAEDLSAILWPQETSTEAIGPITLFERRLQNQVAAVPKVHIIPSPLADKIFLSVKQLESFSKQRAEDRLDELDEIITLALSIMLFLLRSATQLNSNMSSAKEIECKLKRIDELINGSLYLSESEKSEARNAESLLRGFFDELKTNHPKSTILAEYLKNNSSFLIICPDKRTALDLKHKYNEKIAEGLQNYGELSESEKSGTIIPGWYGKNKMAKLLVPPITKHMILILYEVESQWYKAFYMYRQRCRNKRSEMTIRQKIFPRMRGWLSHRTKPIPIKESEEQSLKELESIQDQVSLAYRQKVYRSAKSDGGELEVSARLVFFEGDSYAFLSESFKASVVTHLIEENIKDADENELDVKRKTVDDLREGDALLFHRRSGRDVVRLRADDELSEGVRDKATLWQKALIDYAENERINSWEVWSRLRDLGCQKHYQTILSWMSDTDKIAPRQYERDVRLIATLTSNEDLINDLQGVFTAINVVFGAHQRASHKLAKDVFRHAIEILKQEHRESNLIEIEPDIVLGRIISIDKSNTQVRISIVNHLQETDQ